MRKYQVYRNIRKRALIWGLPISLFALLMISIIASLLVIIFSFGFNAIALVFIWNTGLYVGLTKLKTSPHLFYFRKVFPQSISNKKDNILNHVED